ncbi:MAG: tyrosine-type recombinase/integrase [Kangiellaceae bacterium]|nr:tyrosine-type recombinase/integrase [Kangiellaceae bacterium]
MNVSELRFCANLDKGQEASKLDNYKPLSFPPPSHFVVSVDEQGNPLSKYGDSYWNFKAYGHCGFNFKRQQLSYKNNHLLKQLMFLHLYHMPLFPGKIVSLGHIFKVLCKICKVSDKHGISIDELYRFPLLAAELIKITSPAQHLKLIWTLSSLLRECKVLGWKIADLHFIEQLKKLRVPHIPIQHAYIPPRIWMSLIKSTERVMADFELNKNCFVDAWMWVFEAYKHNTEEGYSSVSPFINTKSVSYGDKKRGARCSYEGGIDAFYKDRGLEALLNRWVNEPKHFTHKLNVMSEYLNLVRDAAFTYILAHSIQRVGEGLSLRSDCFQTDDDPNLGKVGLIVGETTKTDPDSDANWVVPLSVERAVNILNYITQLRLRSTLESIDLKYTGNPYLMIGGLEPFSAHKAKKINQWSLGSVIIRYPLAFNKKDFTISEEDYKIAYQLTPRLTEKSWFKVGGIWSFSAHQLRRSLSVNLFVSDVPDSVIQWMMKHKTLQQSYYYGRNYTRIRVNGEVSRTVMIEAYQTTVRNLVNITKSNLSEYIHAAGENLMDSKVVRLISDGEHKKLKELVKRGLVGARQTLLGFCMVESCQYGGVESAVHCAGVDGLGPCKDAVFVKKNSKRLRQLKESNEEELKSLQENTPRHSKLKLENQAIEVFFHATSEKC